jgi:two-component system OmpR family response regulator
MKELSGRRILVAEDDANTASVIEASLRSVGVEPSLVDTGRAVLDVLPETRPDLIILDVGLPDLSGVDVLRRLREVGHEAPVVFLSARDDPSVKVDALRAGASDYIVKPFHFGELIERLLIALRREVAPVPSTTHTVGELSIDVGAHLVSRQGAAIHLTRTEFNLLELLLVNRGIVISRQQILDAIWGYDFDGDTSIIDSVVSTLRRKIETDDHRPIETIRGIGYVIRRSA